MTDPRAWLTLVLFLSAQGATANPAVLVAAVDPGKVEQGQASLVHPDWSAGRLYFAFRGVTYTARLEIDPKIANADYQRMGKLGRPHGLDAQLKTGLELAQNEAWTVEPLAAALRRAAPTNDNKTLAAFALAMVQALPYRADALTTPTDEAWRSPLLTLIDEQVDCEDSSILYAALLSNLGVKSALVLVPGHMLTAVTGNFSGDYAEHKGQRYYFAETSELGWSIGKLPRSIGKGDGLLIPIDATAGTEPTPVTLPRTEPGGDGPATPTPRPNRRTSDTGRTRVLLIGLLVIASAAMLWALLRWRATPRRPSRNDDLETPYDTPIDTDVWTSGRDDKDRARDPIGEAYDDWDQPPQR